MNNNPFETPEIYDRRIHNFSACMYCNQPFITREHRANITIMGEKTEVICKKCGTKYIFRNWNPSNALGLRNEE